MRAAGTEALTGIRPRKRPVPAPHLSRLQSAGSASLDGNAGHARSPLHPAPPRLTRILTHLQTVRSPTTPCSTTAVSTMRSGVLMAPPSQRGRMIGWSSCGVSSRERRCVAPQGGASGSGGRRRPSRRVTCTTSFASGLSHTHRVTLSPAPPMGKCGTIGQSKARGAGSWCSPARSFSTRRGSP